MSAPELVIPDVHYDCTMCAASKHASDFYWSWNARDRRWQRDSRCKDCHNGTARTASPAKVINRRARQRATALLLEEYAERFAELLAQERRVAAAEYELLQAQIPEGERQVIKPGRRRPGQTVLERLDVARCTQCHTHHDRGHVCPKCGAATEEEIPTEEVIEEEPEEVAIDWQRVNDLCARGYIPNTGEPEIREAVARLVRGGMEGPSIARWLHADRRFIESIINEERAS